MANERFHSSEQTALSRHAPHECSESRVCITKCSWAPIKLRVQVSLSRGSLAASVPAIFCCFGVRHPNGHHRPLYLYEASTAQYTTANAWALHLPGMVGLMPLSPGRVCQGCRGRCQGGSAAICDLCDTHAIGEVTCERVSCAKDHHMVVRTYTQSKALAPTCTSMQPPQSVPHANSRSHSGM